MVRQTDKHVYTHIYSASSPLTTKQPQIDDREESWTPCLPDIEEQKRRKNRNKETSPRFFPVEAGLLARVQLFVLSFLPSTTLSAISLPLCLLYSMKHFQGNAGTISANINSGHKDEVLQWLLQSNQCERTPYLLSSPFPEWVRLVHSCNLAGFHLMTTQNLYIYHALFACSTHFALTFHQCIGGPYHAL